MMSFMHHVGDIILWGFIATSLMTTILLGSQGLGFSRLSLPFLIGTMLTTRLRLAYVLGYAVYAIGGWLFAFVYAKIFVSIGYQTWWIGALLGLGLGLFILISLAHLPYIHPHMACEYDHPRSGRVLEAPGFLGLHYGRQTPIITLLGHALYGSVLGFFLPTF